MEIYGTVGSMRGVNHERINLFSAFVLSALAFYHNISYNSIAYFGLGILVGTFLLNPDLDTNSRPLHRWGPLKIIWKPFRSAGHREILHNLIWGPLILIGFVYACSMFLGFHLQNEVTAGILISTWSHIIADKL